MTDPLPIGGEPWAVILGVDTQDDLVIQALTESVDLPEADALEYRFYVSDASNEVVEGGTDAGASPVAVFAGVEIHYCNGGDEKDCELYTPAGLPETDEDIDPVGRASLDDVPEVVRERAGDSLGGLPMVEPGDLDGGGEPLGPEEFGIDSYGYLPENRDPRGFQ